MHGPERLGCELFALSNLEEHDVSPGPVETSGGHHLLRVSGELFLGITRRRNRLPKNIWDRQRYGGELSDGVTKVWWIIHDINMPGRVGERYFDIIFVGRHFAPSVTDRERSFERWRESVRREWSDYLRSMSRPLTRQIREEYLRPGWQREFLATLRRCQMDQLDQ